VPDDDEEVEDVSTTTGASFEPESPSQTSSEQS
jgi:hypothetical protein